MRRAGRFALPLLLAVAQPASVAADPVAELITAREADRRPETPAWQENSADVTTPSADPVTTEPAADIAPTPSVGIAVSRVVGASAVVAVLLTLTLLVLRWLFRHVGRPATRRSPSAGRIGWRSLWPSAAPSSPADRLEILERSHVGVKESVCIVRAGSERFLIGVTSSQICLLGRLGSAHEGTDLLVERGEGPTGADFARGLIDDAGARPVLGDGSFRELLARARERLSRLGVQAGHRHD